MSNGEQEGYAPSPQETLTDDQRRDIEEGAANARKKLGSTEEGQRLLEQIDSLPQKHRLSPNAEMGVQDVRLSRLPVEQVGLLEDLLGISKGDKPAFTRRESGKSEVAIFQAKNPKYPRMYLESHGEPNKFPDEWTIAGFPYENRIQHFSY